MNALPPDLQRLADDLEAADRTAEALAARLPGDEFFWQPDEGRRWSVALCLDHLAVANAVYGGAVAAGLQHAKERGWTRRGPARPGFFGRLFVWSLEPPVTSRTGAPAAIKPRPARSRDEILAAFHQAHDALRSLIREAAEVDVNRATFPNPFIPLIKVRVSTGLHVVAAHDRRHLWQAEQVEQALRARGGASR